MKNLAFKGDKIRYEEIKEVFKCLGALNTVDFNFMNTDNIYALDSSNYIFILKDNALKSDYNIYNVSYFKQKYPFIIGDSVELISFEHKIGIITEMKWYGHEILYKVKLSNNQEIFVEIKDIQKHNNNVYNNLFEIKSLDKDRLSLKLTNKNYYYELTNGELYILKKNIILPKTYGECCDILGIDDRVYITNTWNLNHEPIIDDYNVSLTGELNELRRLINCRNAYWKLLDYNPEYKEFEDNLKYTIYTFNNKILKSSTVHRNAILSFPTEEIMNVFYENFKDIIERCKNYL